jgi:hypothetical protein
MKILLALYIVQINVRVPYGTDQREWKIRKGQVVFFLPNSRDDCFFVGSQTVGTMDDDFRPALQVPTSE